MPARYQGAGLRPPSKRAERIPTTPVLPGLVNTQLLARESFTAKRRAHQELNRQAAVRNADDASLNCHLPHRAASRDSVGKRACDGHDAVGARRRGRRSSSRSSPPPRRGTARLTHRQCSKAGGSSGCGKRSRKQKSGRWRTQRHKALAPSKIAIPFLPQPYLDLISSKGSILT